jgi:hypothetical protein
MKGLPFPNAKANPQVRKESPPEKKCRFMMIL